MALAFETVWAPANGRPRTLDAGEHQLNVAVVFTSALATITALRTAGALAHRLGARITLLAPQIVPFPLPLESPPVLLDFSEDSFREIAAECPVETNVQIYLCRDRVDTLLSVLTPGSLVVVGGRKRWWRPTSERFLARRLRRAGHEVFYTETE